MALRKLPNEVQSLISASSHVNNYKTAVEELVYNSLDADSTSIAIRINIPESTIQVIDNGYGISKHDLTKIGQRYMTSKLSDVVSLKSAPKKYGCRGEYLANIITISQIVKITSRHETTEETWTKTFYDGKEKKFAKMTTRPTKGTTVDIKGFLHNLNIQRKTIDPIHEQQNIKSFLEQLSLVHNDISLSLRDDSKNEIVFKIHKKRDTYQTLLTLFNIDKADVSELQVEKNEYKVKALIGKTDNELELHWIYLNRKFVYKNRKLHKIINEYFKIFLHLKDPRELKYKKPTDYEHCLVKQNIPFYFIFITCPYIDYDVNYEPRHSVIEFKNWEQINKLLEKLVKFYVGDIKLKEIKKPKIQSIIETDNKNNKETRVQVKNIIHKILGINSKTLGISQLQNGVKGKLIKRKKKVGNKGSSHVKLIKNRSHTNTSNVKEDKDIQHHSKMDHDGKNNIKEIQAHEKSSVYNIVLDNNVEDMKTNMVNSEKSEPKDFLRNKNKITNPTKKKNKTKKLKIKLKKKLTKQAMKINNNLSKTLHGSKETDLVYKKSKIVAQKAEDFLRHDKKARRKENACRNYLKPNFRQMYEKTNCDKPLSPKVQKYIIDRYMRDKLKPKPFKTTYDLVQTMLISQQEEFNCYNNNYAKQLYGDYSNLNFEQSSIKYCNPKARKKFTLTRNLTTKNPCYTDSEQGELSRYFTKVSTTSKTYKTNCFEYNNVKSKQELLINGISYDQLNTGSMSDAYSKYRDIDYRCHKTLKCTLSDRMETKLTYESHHYHQNDMSMEIENANKYSPKKQNVRYITKHSKEFFSSSNIYKFENQSKFLIRRKTKTFNDIHTRQVVDNSMYTIEYSESNFNEINVVSDINCPGTNTNREHDILPNYVLDQKFGNTYTIPSPYLSFNIDRESQYFSKNHFTSIKSNKLFDTYSNTLENKNSSTGINNLTYDKNNINVVFVSKSQCTESETSLNKQIEPLNVCETILRESGTIEREFDFCFHEQNQLNDSRYNNFGNNDTTKYVNNENEPIRTITPKADESVSHHFCSAVSTKAPNVKDDPMLVIKKMNENGNTSKTDEPDNFPNHIRGNIEGIDSTHMDGYNFHFKNRLRFIPKGMSQIFENCHSKTACDYNLDKDYFEDTIYNNFANDVQMNSEVYEPNIQNVEDLTTKDIHKFQNKVQKSNASLIFDETSLKHAKVLGQADCKFIAAIMKEKDRGLDAPTEYLVFFDQHAVHERIRLETNLADYINEERWTSITLDNIALNVTKDEILYLHNYKDKFAQLGLQWTILNDNKITINSIPKAILGKNPREVVKVIKAVKNLIVEEIKVIKLQKGCVSLYPKSIMELVFSEACRYAIKFGDNLSKNDCDELINLLSACKTPFQCAHGRPVMAVLMDIKCVQREYKVDTFKLNRFCRRNATNKK